MTRGPLDGVTSLVSVEADLVNRPLSLCPETGPEGPLEASCMHGEDAYEEEEERVDTETEIVLCQQVGPGVTLRVLIIFVVPMLFGDVRFDA